MKIKLFTHTDFDGLSAGILAKIAFGDNVDIEYCEPNETCDNYIDKKVREFFFSQEVLEYNRIYITDLSIQEDLAKEIDICMKGTCCLPQVVLIDHHPTALELNKYNWCSVIVDVDGEKVSGTSLFSNNFNKIK
jgi:oligoribonuclease NrnB/cAMP/cGMP phosphodiesterase (DHH superfamily)